MKDHPVNKEVIFSGSEDVAAVYVVLQLTVPFDPVGADLDHYQFEVFLHEVLLDLEGEFSLHMAQWSSTRFKRAQQHPVSMSSINLD